MKFLVGKDSLHRSFEFFCGIWGEGVVIKGFGVGGGSVNFNHRFAASTFFGQMPSKTVEFGGGGRGKGLFVRKVGIRANVHHLWSSRSAVTWHSTRQSWPFCFLPAFELAPNLIQVFSPAHFILKSFNLLRTALYTWVDVRSELKGWKER